MLGDTQTAATTVANLQAIGLSQEDLIRLTDAATGAWAKYGDSIPIDGLAEAINETVQAGKVTGVFADVLNWAGTSEDAFNEKLATTTDASKRAQMVLAELYKQDLVELGQGWRDVNEDIVEANESQARMDEAMGRLGEALSPVANAIRNVGADAITWLADRITEAIDAFQSLWNTMTKFDLETNARQQSMAASRGYVPSDSIASTADAGERALAAADNSAWRSVTSGSGSKSTAASVTQTINLSVDLDGQRLSRTTYSYNKAEEQRRGFNFVNG